MLLLDSYLSVVWAGALAGSAGRCTAPCSQAGTAGWRGGTGLAHSNTLASAEEGEREREMSKMANIRTSAPGALNTQYLSL